MRRNTGRNSLEKLVTRVKEVNPDLEDHKGEKSLDGSRSEEVSLANSGKRSSYSGQTSLHRKKEKEKKTWVEGAMETIKKKRNRSKREDGGLSHLLGKKSYCWGRGGY